MTIRKETKLNWAADKILLAVIGFFGVQTYMRLDKMAEIVSATFTQVQLHEQTINVLKSISGLK